MSAERWTPSDLPDLQGHVALVTGANSGLGFHTVLELARAGARVLMTARDPMRGDEALGQVRVLARVRAGEAAGRPVSVELLPLDLADLRSVRALAARVSDDVGRLDLLVNNAGVMALPRAVTADGFELQLGTNHLGHAALTGLLLPLLVNGSVAGGPARVVTVSSILHRIGWLHRDDLMGERHYSPWVAYGQSKLANLLFAFELQRRADVAGQQLASLAAHPGYADTNLQSGPARATGHAWQEWIGTWGNRLFAQPAAQGAWPSLRAAGDPTARGGQFYGPGGFAEQRGNPRVVGASRRARDLADAAWLWERTVELTGVGFDALLHHA